MFTGADSFIYFGIGVGVGFLGRTFLQRMRYKAALEEAKNLLEKARREAETIKKEAIIQAKDSIYQARAELEKEIKEKRAELQNFEKRLLAKEDSLEKKSSFLQKKEMEAVSLEKELEARKEELSRKEKVLEEAIENQKRKLEEIAGMRAEEAKTKLMEMMKKEAKVEAALALKKIEDELREKADQMAKEIIALSIQRYAAEYVAENCVSVVTLPNEEMKGRIIGREGRNIKTLEAITGVDLIIDDTPETVVISSFNPIRREIAKISLERLINDGRIHPARIEEVVTKVAQELDESIKETGKQVLFDLGIHGVNPELIKLIGKLRYRTSFSQNVLQHSIEVATICGIMAAELGLDQKLAKRAGLLHDIGKAVDHEVEGSHAIIGAEIAKRYGESDEIVHAIAAHHEDEKPNSVLAVLVQAADTLSAARPGARKEMLESYVKRIEELERIGSSFEGVEKCYAVQAGRELRIIVKSNVVSDEQAFLLSKEIAKSVEKEVSYPGQIKITVIRETRAIEYAK